MGDKPIARPLPTYRTAQRINTHRRPCLEWIRTNDLTVSVGEDSSCLWLRFQCDQRFSRMHHQNILLGGEKMDAYKIGLQSVLHAKLKMPVCLEDFHMSLRQLPLSGDQNWGSLFGMGTCYVLFFNQKGHLNLFVASLSHMFRIN